MSKPKFKVGDEITVLFLENVCRKKYRSNSDYSKYVLPHLCVGYIKSINQYEDEDGNLYAIEFDKKEIIQLQDILSKLKEESDDWKDDVGLHTCINLVKSGRGRWILEDAIRSIYEPIKSTKWPPVKPRKTILRALLETCQHKKEQKKVETV